MQIYTCWNCTITWLYTEGIAVFTVQLTNFPHPTDTRAYVQPRGLTGMVVSALRTYGMVYHIHSVFHGMSRMRAMLLTILCIALSFVIAPAAGNLHRGVERLCQHLHYTPEQYKLGKWVPAVYGGIKVSLCVYGYTCTRTCTLYVVLTCSTVPPGPRFLSGSPRPCLTQRTSSRRGSMKSVQYLCTCVCSVHVLAILCQQILNYKNIV